MKTPVIASCTVFTSAASGCACALVDRLGVVTNIRDSINRTLRGAAAGHHRMPSPTRVGFPFARTSTSPHHVENTQRLSAPFVFVDAEMPSWVCVLVR
jgi:hypothetical protein